ncbi:alpha/beta hydrolase [Actinoplanes sp. NPDC051861]|uniref:alpha/beta fold hydrolase n=1 Tax=Actinoplanes sp. NPDC051861 TaxID=3155170 RepID=UPI003431D267
MTEKRIRWAAAMIIAAGWGALSAWWTPRGPLTNVEAIWSIVISAAVGVGAGLATRSRWAIPLTPLMYATTLELCRITVSGPSVDAPHASAFGLVALITGRGVHGLLSLLPMAVGAACGRALGAAGRARGGPGRTRAVAGRVLLGLSTAVVIAVAALVALPARTAPVPGGVAELTTVDGLGVMIRGVDTSRPVLLFVPGTPGGSEVGAMRLHLAELEMHFVVATLDRRGGGASYPALSPGRLTVDGTVADILTVTDHLRARFRQDRIYLLAFSGGSVAGALAASRAPSKYRAYIGTGQTVDVRASDEIFYADILAWARAGGRDDLVRQLSSQGPPPYPDFWSYEPIVLHENQAYGQNAPAVDIDVPEFTMLQKAHTLTAVMDTWSILYPRMQETDLRREVPSLTIPAYFIQGENEMRGLSVLFEQWYTALRAPSKRLDVIPGAGHRAMFEEPARFVAILAALG